MKRTMYPIAKLTSPKRPPQKLAGIIDSLTRSGFAVPIRAYRDGTVVGGHGRLAAARELGYDRVPVIWVEGESSDAEMADARLLKLAEWGDTLVEALEQIDESGVSLDGLAGLLDASGPGGVLEQAWR